MNTGVITSPALLSGMSKVYKNKLNELTMPAAVALEYHVGNNLMVLENNHLQFQSGFLPQEHWQRNLAELECMLTVPLFQDVAKDWKFRASFGEVWAGFLQKIPADAENCWVYDWDFPVQ